MKQIKMQDGIVPVLEVGQIVSVLFVGKPDKPCCVGASFKVLASWAGGFNGGYIVEIFGSRDPKQILAPGCVLNMSNDGSSIGLPGEVPVLNYYGGMIDDVDRIDAGKMPKRWQSIPELYGDVLLLGIV